MILPAVYPILDTEVLARCCCGVREAASALLDAGAGILQIRHKQHWSRSLFEDAAWVADESQKAGGRLVINDRADFAALLGAGLHVGQEDLPPVLARRLIGEHLLGFSTHNTQQLEAARDEPVDYLALGPIFGTQSKDKPDPVVGVENLRAWRGLTAKPLVAIGGITRQTAEQVWEAGADSIAVIGDLFPAGASAAEIRKRMEEWQQLARK